MQEPQETWVWHLRQLFLPGKSHGGLQSMESKELDTTEWAHTLNLVQCSCHLHSFPYCEQKQQKIVSPISSSYQTLYYGNFQTSMEVGRILLWTTIDSKIAPCPFYFNWRISTLQYCNGFCHASTWISPGYTCVPAVLTSPPTSLLTPWPFQLLQLNFKILFRSTQPFHSFISM